MHLGVIHEIRDPAGWDRVMGSQELYGHPDLPPGFAILASVTQDDAARGVCFWEAPSAAELQGLLEGRSVTQSCTTSSSRTQPGR